MSAPPIVYAIVPARSGSKGLPDKNVRKMAGTPLMAYSISFATALGVDRVFCSTDSTVYADIAARHGAEVPFLRSAAAAADTAMEEDILEDMESKFIEHKIPLPDIYVWLRPTFPFRAIDGVRECIRMLIENPILTAARTVVPAESRLYADQDGLLCPQFDDGGRSMCRRQNTVPCFRVYSTDVFRGRRTGPAYDFLGRTVGYVEIPKVCGMDIDDDFDWMLAEMLMTYQGEKLKPYLFL